jgi:hypothetical protein
MPRPHRRGWIAPELWQCTDATVRPLLDEAEGNAASGAARASPQKSPTEPSFTCLNQLPDRRTRFLTMITQRGNLGVQMRY